MVSKRWAQVGLALIVAGSAVGAACSGGEEAPKATATTKATAAATTKATAAATTPTAAPKTATAAATAAAKASATAATK
ncbi:MAG: hypothetical protein IT299_01355 [Dehalococcoidia bacterium]|nr:hypothetical protein [Dehalococcoidia bacterium]